MRFSKDVGWSTLVAAASALLMFVAAQSAMAAGIAGTKHDFSNSSTYTWNTSGQICVVCHAPHNTKTTGQLWNRPDSAATYTMYTSPFGTLDNATTAAPGNVSKLCLSCHDGTVALDAFGPTATATSGTAATKITGTSNLGASLADDHPIGMSHDPSKDAGLKTLASAKTAGLKFYGGTSDVVECASCHDVHDSAGISKFLRVSNAASALCITCHSK